MKLPQTFLQDTNTINAVIETPQGSRNKYGYNQEQDFFELGKVLPAGTSFPFDFGFIPHTKAADGDPLDILVLNDSPSFPGCVVPVRIIGVLIAEQKERNQDPVRNDRILGVATRSLSYSDLNEISDLNENRLNEIAHFFEYYNQIADKGFKVLKNENSKSAIRLIKEQMVNK
jgi:inorganic pyrophosphatase